MQKIKQKRTIILSLFVLVTLVWGFGFSLVKMTMDRGVPEFFLMGARFSIASVALIVIRLFTKKNLRFKAQEVKVGGILGILLFASFALQTFGLATTTPAKSGILTSCYVVIVPIVMMIYKRRFLVKPLTDAIICLFGMMIFFNVFESFSNVGWGDVLTILSSGIFALHIIFLGVFSRKLDALDLSIFQMVFCALISILASVTFESSKFGGMDWQFMIGAVVFMGIFTTGFAYLIQTLAQKYFSPTTVSMVACLEAVFATVFSLFLGFETLTPYLVVGAIYIFFSIIRALVLPKVTYSRFL